MSVHLIEMTSWSWLTCGLSSGELLQALQLSFLDLLSTARRSVCGCSSCILVFGSQSCHNHCTMFTSASTSSSSSSRRDNRDNKLGAGNYASAHLALYTRWRIGRRLCWKYTRKMDDMTNRDGWLSGLDYLWYEST